MLRRGVGVGALKKREQTQQTFKAVGAKLESSQLAHLQASLATFRSSLESFAFKYKEEIRSNPLFRAQFHRMCQSAGVDPLACHKGFWASMLGLGDFYYELSVQVVDVCLATREKNGGLIEMQEVLRILKAKYKHQQSITVDDVSQSVSKLSCLGSGFVVLAIGGPRNLDRHLLKSVPLEINVDHLTLIKWAATQGQGASDEAKAGAGEVDAASAAAEAAGRSSSGSQLASSTVAASGSKGCVLPSVARAQLGWSAERLRSCVSLLLEEGMLWVDTQGTENSFWFPSLGVQ